MTPDIDVLSRLRFLVRVIQRERQQLMATDQRIFTVPFSVARAQQLDTDVELSERVEAFVARFTRLQDTLSATLYSPLTLFVPASVVFFLLGCANYADTLITYHRLTNMGTLLWSAAVIVFLNGLVFAITGLMYRRYE